MKKTLLFLSMAVLFSAVASTQVINVVQPNGGEMWKLGETRQIQWTASGLSNNMRVILLKDGAMLGIIADNVDFNPNNANYSVSWPVGTYSGGNAAAGGGYKIRVKEKNTTNQDQSQNAFEILEAGTTTEGPKLKPGSLAGLAEIKVTSPASTSYWDCGNSYTICWETPAKQAFKIELYKYNMNDKLDDIATMLLIPGHFYNGKYSFTWHIPADYAHAPGKRAIRISTVNGVCKGFSQAFSLRKSIGQEKTASLNPDAMDCKYYGHKTQYSKSSSPGMPSPENQGLGKVAGQLRVGYASFYNEYSIYGEWVWWTMIFRSRVHFDLGQYTGDKIFLVKATLHLKKESTITTTGNNHCALGLWQLTGAWNNCMDSPGIHVRNIGQMGGSWDLDVTPQVREWVQGMRSNDGFVLTGINESPGKVTEKCVSHYTARLDLAYIEK
jgi:hypothetical protein